MGKARVPGLQDGSVIGKKSGPKEREMSFCLGSKGADFVVARPPFGCRLLCVCHNIDFLEAYIAQ